MRLGRQGLTCALGGFFGDDQDGKVAVLCHPLASAAERYRKAPLERSTRGSLVSLTPATSADDDELGVHLFGDPEQDDSGVTLDDDRAPSYWPASQRTAPAVLESSSASMWAAVALSRCSSRPTACTTTISGWTCSASQAAQVKAPDALEEPSTPTTIGCCAPGFCRDDSSMEIAPQ